jgi:hypothetical protein
MWNAQGSGEMRTGFLWENLRDRDHSEDLDVKGNAILKWINLVDFQLDE